MQADKSKYSFDTLLYAFLNANTKQQADIHLEVLMQQQIEPLVKNIIRRKLHVSLYASDYRRQNQDALEIVNDVKTTLIDTFRKLKDNSEDRKIINLSAYVKTIILHAAKTKR